MEHEFTKIIKEILHEIYGDYAEEVYRNSYLLQYINNKTKSANRGSKSRGSFANLYAIYVLVEDYISKGYMSEDHDYNNYDGAMYTDLLTRMRNLPFGRKLQNHALNSRMNEEFKKYFPLVQIQPIMRDLHTKRYWINEELLKVNLKDGYLNIAEAIIEIINAYIETKMSAFNRFIEYTTRLAEISSNNPKEAIDFINLHLAPNVDARIFEIISYSILKVHYAGFILYWGWEPKKLNEENLKLYKTGRTNANDGGIDFVMKPLGRFFQVTETLDVKKYFLDIDKIQRYPITFVIKTEIPRDEIYQILEENAKIIYSINRIVKRYMESIEEVINLPDLRLIFSEQVQRGNVKFIMEEIVRQSKTEFNYE